MIDLTSQIDAVLRDARKAAVPGTIGNSPNRPDAVLLDSLSSKPYRTTVPSASPLSVAISGPGLFVLGAGGQRVYGRLGNFRVNDRGVLVDGEGRAVLGYPASSDSGRRDLQPLRVAQNLRKRFEQFAIDEHGVFLGFAACFDSGGGTTTRNSTRLGQVALAIFPAPSHLHRAGETVVHATAETGRPMMCLPGDPNVGQLFPHALETGLVDLEGDFARLWSLQRRAEFQVEIASAADSCTRAAAGLVK
jgi:flagellar hook protein FlgE